MTTVPRDLVALPTLGSEPCPVCAGVVLSVHLDTRPDTETLNGAYAERGAPFTCPQCGATSYHPEDARQGYCGACHAFTGQLVLPMLLRLEPCGHQARGATLNSVGQVVSWHPQPTPAPGSQRHLRSV